MQGLTMTGSDLSSSSKDWEVQHRISTLVYAEFNEQVELYTVIHYTLYTVLHCYTLYTI